MAASAVYTSRKMVLFFKFLAFTKFDYNNKVMIKSISIIVNKQKIGRLSLYRFRLKHGLKFILIFNHSFKADEDVKISLYFQSRTGMSVTYARCS